MSVNIEVTRTNENTTSLIRKFSRKVQGSGILPKVKSRRYHSRSQSSFKKKEKALKSIRRRAEIQELIKLGKIQERPRRR